MLHLIRRKQFSLKIAFATFPYEGKAFCGYPHCSSFGRSGCIRQLESLPLRRGRWVSEANPDEVEVRGSTERKTNRWMRSNHGG